MTARFRYSSYAARRRRRRWRVVALLAALAVVAGVVWITAIGRAADTNARASCPMPADARWQPLPYTGLDTVPPAPASTIRVRVLNAGAQRGLASLVGAQLQQLGFTLAAPPDNDPHYPREDMHCMGQIRFGLDGEDAARTLSLVVPCTQLVRDNRRDDTVDLALGTNLTGVAPSANAQRILNQLAAWSRQHPQPTGGPQSDGESGPHLAAGLLAGAHTSQC
ncbi:MAG TPA: envelope integrity protein Cei [Pseudonocardiaceae bacterium]|nr:envelope integrity protein Cei [Pseudonocardiaceae bacterium]